MMVYIRRLVSVAHYVSPCQTDRTAPVRQEGWVYSAVLLSGLSD
jgi:hypothetical protein